MITVRPAFVFERQSLEALQWRASLANPEDREAMLANPDAIELPVGQLEAGGVFVAEEKEVLVGFAAILPCDDGDSELDGLFVEPVAWRRGIGRALVQHCCETAAAAGHEWLWVVGNYHSEAFYRACNFEVVGPQQTRFGAGLLMKRSLS